MAIYKLKKEIDDIFEMLLYSTNYIINIIRLINTF